MSNGASAANWRVMWPYHPQLLETPVPRYTSFPTAAEFSNTIGATDFERAIATASGDISLYVHIPFCGRICWYCGCNTGAANRRERLAGYLDSLQREIAIVGAALPRGVRIRRIAFGGGSPNAISPTDFVRLVDTLTVHFSPGDPAWSIELDPRTLTGDWRLVIASIGIANASLGVQTFAPHLQQAIGRVQPDADIERATAMLREAGVTSLNFDLIYGLPGQTTGDLEHTLAHTIELGPDRIALFGYAHVPHLIPRQKRIDASALPEQAERFAMAWLGYSMLTSAGYRPIGFDHFARPEDPLVIAADEARLHRNFQGFTDDDAPVLIGLGASAISSFPELIVQNEKNTGRYRMLLSQGRHPKTLGVIRSRSDRATGRLIEALLCHGAARLETKSGRAQAASLSPFIDLGLVVIDGDQLRILPAGLPYARTIAAHFDPYRQHLPHRFSSAV